MTDEQQALSRLPSPAPAFIPDTKRGALIFFESDVYLIEPLNEVGRCPLFLLTPAYFILWCFCELLREFFLIAFLAVSLLEELEST